MKKKKISKISIISSILIIGGIICICFPYISNYFYEKDVEDDKDEFIEKFLEEDNNDNNNNNDLLDLLYQKLKEENEKLYETNQENLTDPFSYEQASIDLSEYGIENNIIGYITIPKIDISLPILLGANTENMKLGAVHLTETSYPIGGENTNSVIAAHRGYSTAKMFRNIDKLEIGDVIYIQNFREELTYCVYDIKIISPSDVEELKIEEGKDIITLITCHPYRVNTQRYVVKAKAE